MILMVPWNETLSAVSDFNLLKAQSWKKKTNKQTDKTNKNKTKQKDIKMSVTLIMLNNTKINANWRKVGWG